MSDESSAAIRDTRKDWASEHREMYLESGGAKGHIMDITPVGGRAFATHCMIKYIGRKSGKVFITPLCYADIGGEQDTVDFQVATQAFRGTWREPEGAERDKVWAFMADCHPFYESYQKATDRVIPLVMMKAVEPIPVFKMSDATGERQF
jgi:hypothetical protein